MTNIVYFCEHCNTDTKHSIHYNKGEPYIKCTECGQSMDFSVNNFIIHILSAAGVDFGVNDKKLLEGAYDFLGDILWHDDDIMDNDKRSRLNYMRFKIGPMSIGQYLQDVIDEELDNI